MTAHVVVVVLAVVFTNLGLWQLRRLDERQLENSVAASRYEAPPTPLEELLAGAGSDFDSLEYRRATVDGTFDVSTEVLMRNQVFRDQAGFHVVTPLILEDGDAVLVNRGWVPLLMDEPGDERAAPDATVTTLTGWISLNQERPPLGAEEPEDGVLDIMNRVDISRIAQQVPYDVEPVYLVLEGERSGETLPVALAAPELTDEGSHLAYAIQWFGFTIVGLVGYGALLRKNLSRS